MHVGSLERRLRRRGGRSRVVGAEKVSVVLDDDSVDVRTLVRMRLESSGRFAVVGEAADGEEAIGLVIRHQPQAVLLDVSMPAMDGLETLPSILALRPDTAVVMFSGFGGTDLAGEARSLGAVGFIEKSIPLEQLADRLLQILHGAGSEPTGASSDRTDVAAGGGDGEEVDVEQLEQAILDEHLEGFRALFDHAAIGMATLTVHATIVRANVALAKLMSCEPSDLVGVDYGRLTGGRGDVLEQHLESLRSSEGDVATFEHPVPAAPGARTVRTAHVTLVPIRDSTGRMLYVFAQVQDITAQRAAEVELRRTEETFRLLVAAVEDYAIFMLEPSGVVASWNAGARRIKGYVAEEILGRHFRVFYPEEDQLTGHPERNLDAPGATGPSPRRDGGYVATAAGSGPAS
jgi:PAS domain S-box-containing protein